MELTAATRMLTLRLVETKDKEDEHSDIQKRGRAKLCVLRSLHSRKKPT